MPKTTNILNNALDLIDRRLFQKNSEADCSSCAPSIPPQRLNTILGIYARKGELMDKTCFIEDCDRPTFYLRGGPEGEYEVKGYTWDHAGDDDEQETLREVSYRLVPVPIPGGSDGPSLRKHQIVGMRSAAQADQFFLWEWTLKRLDVPGQGVEAVTLC